MQRESDQQPVVSGDRGRRTFLNRLWALFGVLVCVELSWVGGSILRSRKKRAVSSQSEKIVVAGLVDEFKPGTVTPVPQGQFYLARLDDGSFLALSKTCTHLGCALPWNEDEKKFICPCHGSTFNLRGEPQRSPAHRPLDYYPTRIENGVVKVLSSSGQRRTSFNPAQTVSI